MGRKHEAVEWLWKGCSPSKIAAEMGVSVATVMGYLYNQVGEGAIRRSDIVFSVDKDKRESMERAIFALKLARRPGDWPGSGARRVLAWLHKRGQDLNLDEIEIYVALRDARIALGDMYELIRDIELALHSLVKNVLSQGYGPVEWWREGIPEHIRVECAAARERDPEPADDPFCYTNLIHLKDILEKRWDIFSKVLPPKLAGDRKRLFARLVKLNQIRNLVMHPVKGRHPTEEDFCFVREFRAHLLPEQARTDSRGRVVVSLDEFRVD